MPSCNPKKQSNRKRDLPEKRTFKRVHGLQPPLHPLQVLGWVVLVGISAGTFFTLIPLLEPKLRPPLLVLVSILLLFHLVSHLVALLVDPAEAAVRLHRAASQKPEFDRTKHLHIIENGRCHLCNVDATGSRTKHCWDCNKCIAGFDHHCKWLNNCIGQRNYAAFICCVVSAIAATLAVLAIVVLELTNVSASHAMDSNSTTVAQTPGMGSLVVVSVVGILSTIAALLLIHLCLFHGYIACLGLTTYEFMRNRRDKQQTKVENNKTNPKNSPLVQSPCGDPVRYHFCESVSVRDPSQADPGVYICSTHSVEGSEQERKNERIRKKFHLYFSYETRSNETTSIELTSSTTQGSGSGSEGDLPSLSPLKLKPSTPSPVSCCFSILHSSSREKQKRDGEELETERRSCGTMKRRIQTFLRVKLRKGVRQKSLSLEAAGVRRNKVVPLGGSDSGDNPVKSIYDSVREDALQVRPPNKLPPLVLNSRGYNKSPNSVHSPTASVALKRNQHMRVRKTVTRKRPRFRMGSHVTGSAQLSPIPESELSKPTSPLSPPEHFTFSPVHKK